MNARIEAKKVIDTFSASSGKWPSCRRTLKLYDPTSCRTAFPEVVSIQGLIRNQILGTRRASISHCATGQKYTERTTASQHDASNLAILKAFAKCYVPGSLEENDIEQNGCQDHGFSR